LRQVFRGGYAMSTLRRFSARWKLT
jgi:hypothetical protein